MWYVASLFSKIVALQSNSPMIYFFATEIMQQADFVGFSLQPLVARGGVLLFQVLICVLHV